MCVFVAERGFINLTEGEDSVVEVREGESLTLSVEMTSYPKPSEIYWLYNNQQLKNTSEHVITLHNQQYRYTHLHIYTHSQFCGNSTSVFIHKSLILSYCHWFFKAGILKAKTII